MTKVVGYNLAYVGSFLIKFEYFIDIPCKFFSQKNQGSNSKNDRFKQEKTDFTMFTLIWHL